MVGADRWMPDSGFWSLHAQESALKAEPTDAKGSIKFFILDTNVLLHNPGALFMFADNQVVVPFTVLEELDKFK